MLYDKVRACGAQKGVLISSSNFQIGAIEHASQHGIALIQLTEEDCLYETRSDLKNVVAESKANYKTQNHYIGVMLVSSENNVIGCSYLSESNLSLKNFIVSNQK